VDGFFENKLLFFKRKSLVTVPCDVLRDALEAASLA
jgi:hypothetical protein